MYVHHLNCGSMRAVEPARHSGLAPLPVVCHCLLVETDADGLVLVETGFGTADVRSPERSLGADFLNWAQPRLDPEETAIHQLSRLGYAASDVRHILLTHLHRDHTGGLPDFPHATVHVLEDEYGAAMNSGRYPQEHWAHGPRWATHPGSSGDDWFGFRRAYQPAGLRCDVLLIPMAGHSPGHAAIAVNSDQGWLLHVGDTYYYHGEAEAEPKPAPPLLEALQATTETDRTIRIENLERIRRLARDRAADVRILSAHDPWEFERFRQPPPAAPVRSPQVGSD